jgi:hypothetical protein
MLSNTENKAIWSKRYQLFTGLYRGREDRVGIRKDDSYAPIPAGLTYERFMEHLEFFIS